MVIILRYILSLASIWLAILSSMKYEGWKLILANVILVYVFYGLGGLYGGWGDSLILLAVIILEAYFYIKKTSASNAMNLTLDQNAQPVVPENRSKPKAIGGFIVGLYSTIIFLMPLISHIFPKLQELLNSNDILMEFFQIPLFLAVTVNIIPFLIFLIFIIKRIKGIKEGRENFTWSLLSIIFNSTAFILLLIIILSTGGKCFPGFTCF